LICAEEGGRRDKSLCLIKKLDIIIVPRLTVIPYYQFIDENWWLKYRK